MEVLDLAEGGVEFPGEDLGRFDRGTGHGFRGGRAARFQVAQCPEKPVPGRFHRLPPVPVAHRRGQELAVILSGPGQFAHGREERAGLFVAAGHGLLQRAGERAKRLLRERAQERHHPAFALSPAASPVDSVQRVNRDAEAETRAELVGGNVFDVVRLIDDQVVELRDRAAARGEVGEKQGVVDHQDVGRLGGLARTEQEARAFAHVPVLAGEAVRILCAEALPGDPLIGGQVELRAVSGGGFGKPEEHG